MAALQERDMRILAFERRIWRSPGAKELEIRESFAISATRYYQLLNELIDRPEAAAVRSRPGQAAASPAVQAGQAALRAPGGSDDAR